MVTPPHRPAPWMREELLHLLSISATLAGLCVPVVALMKAIGKPGDSATIADDMFAVCALLFLASIGRRWFLKRPEGRVQNQRPRSNRACGFPAHGLPVACRLAALRGPPVARRFARVADRSAQAM